MLCDLLKTMLFWANFASLGSVPIVTKGYHKGGLAELTFQTLCLNFKIGSIVIHFIWSFNIWRESLFWRRGWVRTSEGEEKRWSSAGLKGFSSLCDPCNIKAHLPNPRQCSLCCPCIWQTSWVSAGRIQPLLCNSKRIQRSEKCRARPSVCPASH